MDLPIFCQWESFRDHFVALIHSCPNLNKVQKHLYLQTHLSGDAEDLLKNIQVTDNSYDGAWASLEDRYGNVRLLSGAHKLHLINSVPATKQSASEINRLIDSCQQTVRSLAALGKTTDD